MAKHNCAICGTEVGLLAQQQLADKTYICRKVCAKRCLKALDLVPATLNQVTAHIEQVEFGTKVWEQIFVPLKKTKDKEAKLKGLCQYDQLVVSPSTGLIALTQDDYKFFIFGKTTRACVFRLADLYVYEYEKETEKDSEGKEVIKHYCHFVFNNVAGLYDFRLPVSSEKAANDIAEYFNTLFGIQKTLGNALNNARNQLNAIGAFAGAAKAIKNGEADSLQKSGIAIDAMNVAAYGDRTEWIRRADATLQMVN